MLSNTRGSVPMIFFVTDGSVEDERHICNVMKKRLASGGSVSPRIHTFGLGKTFLHGFDYLFLFTSSYVNSLQNFQVFSVITTSCKRLQIYQEASMNQFITQVTLCLQKIYYNAI